MNDEDAHWLRHFFYLLLVTAGVQTLQAALGVWLWMRVASPVLFIFGLDALVGACRELVLARRIRRHGTPDADPGHDRWLLVSIGIAYFLIGLMAIVTGIAFLWQGRRPDPTLLGVALAAASMLVIPIIGSYMKALAMELRSPALKTAAVFTFGNSYLSMVLLVSLLVNAGMERGWSDAVGAIVMVPFIVGKGIQILTEARPPEFVSD